MLIIIFNEYKIDRNIIISVVTFKYLQISNIMKKQMQNTKLEIEDLFKKYYATLCLTSFCIVKDKDIAKDIVQDFFISYWQKKESLPITHYFKAYSAKAVKNLSLQYVAKLKKEKSLIDSLPIQSYSEQVSLDKPSKINTTQELLNRLPEGRRNIFTSIVLEGKSYSEIADKNGISINTVKTQMKRAYAYLRLHATEDMLHIFIISSIVF